VIRESEEFEKWAWFVPYV